MSGTRGLIFLTASSVVYDTEGISMDMAAERWSLKRGA